MKVNEQKLNEFMEKAINDLAAGYGGVMVALGDKLGLYKAMAGQGPLSSTEVAKLAGCAERYVREWLNSQAAAGYVVYHPSSETYELTPEQAMVLANEDSPVFLPPAWAVPASMWFDEDKSIEAFRTGKGIGWDEHNPRLYQGVAAFYRNAYQGQLVSDWLPALQNGTETLNAGAKIADVGCGHGHSTIIMAEAFPGSRFWGFDIHPDSIEAARGNAKKRGLDDRVTFEVADAKNYPAQGFDLICFFDCLHDMGDPVGACRRAAEVLKADGTALIVEPMAGNNVQENFNPVGRTFTGASTLCCTSNSLALDGPALGAVCSEDRLREVVLEGGFKHFRRATETPFNRVFEARK